MRFLIYLLIVVLLAAGTATSAETLTIGLINHFRNVPQVTISSTSDFQVVNPDSAPLVTLTAGEKITISSVDGSLQVQRENREAVKVGLQQVEVASSSPDAFVLLSSPNCHFAQYRGRIVVKSGEKGVSLLNVVELDDYLRGVLPSEMPSSFHLEALKAQAVAARTYAWNNRSRHGSLGYDLCDTTCCQVYLGGAGEKPSTSEAIKQTAGLVMTCNGRLISALYSADCGGITRNGSDDYLKSVKDKSEDGLDYCDHEGHSWSKSWPIVDFEKLLSKLAPGLKGLKNVTVADTDPTGRILNIKLDADSGSTTVTGSEMRKLLGLMVVRSTLFNVKVENEQVCFTGKGFGHGVGMCQWGANGMASPPYNCSFDQILRHYYSGIEIVPLSAVR